MNLIPWILKKKSHPTVGDVWWTNTVYQNNVSSSIASFLSSIFKEQQFMAHGILPYHTILYHIVTPFVAGLHLTKPGSQQAKHYTNRLPAFTLQPCIESVGLQECLQSLKFWPWSVELVDHRCRLGKHLANRCQPARVAQLASIPTTCQVTCACKLRYLHRLYLLVHFSLSKDSQQ